MAMACPFDGMEKRMEMGILVRAKREELRFEMIRAEQGSQQWPSLK